ncbi:hypothetical protein C0Q70_14509 [Pomacea canaliculata]|uniref:EB domain-containing protein n=1 Tax=Pomacea canaliculata TaxID=400727 RepID=A0A2T7NS91_POMCA|nr:hypothetical protein C0Q70_14509 [Pomacea canaliculata]
MQAILLVTVFSCLLAAAQGAGAGEACDATNTCADTNSACVASKCACNDGYTQSGTTCNKTPQAAGPGAGEACDATHKCADANAACVAAKCACNDGYTQSGKTCSKTQAAGPGVGEACDSTHTCADANSNCVAANRGIIDASDKALGEDCTFASGGQSNCADANAICTPSSDPKSKPEQPVLHLPLIVFHSRPALRPASVMTATLHYRLACVVAAIDQGKVNAACDGTRIWHGYQEHHIHQQIAKYAIRTCDQRTPLTVYYVTLTVYYLSAVCSKPGDHSVQRSVNSTAVALCDS